MKFLPKTKFAKIRLAVLLGVLTVVACQHRVDRVGRYMMSDKQEGDILFQSLPHGNLVDAIEGVSQSSWSHCGILVKNDGQWMVAEAIGSVRQTPLYFWLVRSRGGNFQAYRVADLPADSANKLHQGVSEFFGREYDFRYAPGDEEIYCSELVYKIFDRKLAIKIGRWERLGELNWRPYEAFIRKMESGGLPLDREMITPVALTRSSNIHRVF